MVSTVKIYEDLRETLNERAARQIAHYLGAIYEDWQQTATKADMAELRSVVRELAQAQKQTEVGLNELRSTVAELAQAQKRTEIRVEELAQAQKQTEIRIEELAQAQKRTEIRVEELAQAQKRTEDTMQAGFRDIHRRFDVLGSRWGDGAEEAFRQGLLETVRGLGYTVEHYHGQDPDGFINYTPRSFDLDVLVHDGGVVVAEIKSNASGADVTEFHRSVLLWENQTRRKASKRILVAVTLQPVALERAKGLGIIVATDFASLEPRK
jgi:hypothetical protein